MNCVCQVKLREEHNDSRWRHRRAEPQMCLRQKVESSGGASEVTQRKKRNRLISFVVKRSFVEEHDR